MGTYDFMKKCLQGTGLYSLPGSSTVDYELQAYAAGLDPLFENLKKLQAESFTATAESFGLSYREAACGIPYPETKTDRRREVLCALGAVSPGSCTKTELENLLKTLGFTAEMTEDIPNRKICIHITVGPLGGANLWQETIRRFLPAHLTAEFS